MTDRRGGLLALLLALSPAPAAVGGTPHHHATTHGGWTYRSEADKLRDGVSRWACTRSTNLVRLGFPYHPQPLELCLRDEPGSGLNVFFDLPAGGQFECLQGCDIEARFDAGEVRSLGADTPSDGSDDTMFLDDEAPFIRAALSARRLVVGVTLYNAGDQQLVFDIGGLRWARPREFPKPSGAAAPVTASAPPSAPRNMTGSDIPNPEWARQPTVDDMARLYPERAQRMGVSGHVSLRCTANVNGTISDCAVISETPADQEFGSSALKAARLYKLNPMMPDGRSVEGGRVVVLFDFRPPTD